MAAPMPDPADTDPDLEEPAPEELCVCFHVPLRKVAKFIRLNRPRVASQCSECYGAGTGCGWCIPFIEKLFEQVAAGDPDPHIALSPGEYRRRRREHLRRIGVQRRDGDDPAR